jgi:hypothetical protein
MKLGIIFLVTMSLMLSTAFFSSNFSRSTEEINTSHYYLNGDSCIQKSFESNEIVTFKDIASDGFANCIPFDSWKTIGGKGESPIHFFSSLSESLGVNKSEELADFHDYSELTSELQTIASTYPNITNLYELGQSVQGRSIWGLKITDNPDIEENEAEIRFDGCHHGNEYMSVEMPLLLAWHLVENYSVDPTVTDYVDNREIWIVPMVNPDGRQLNQRYNANYVDINRDYGYMWSGEGGSPSPFSQPEVQAIREHGLHNNIVISYSYHTTAEYVNYLWDYKPNPSPDEPWIDMISQHYSDLSGYVKTNGFDWYQTTGASDDGNYGCFGNINTIIETLNSNIADEWDRNRDAMMFAIDVADMGLSGIVTDAVTGDPIAASIWVEENNWPVFTDPLVGDYHKPLFEGTYHVHFQANGYEEQVKQITITDANASNILNASLITSDDYYAYQVTMCEYFTYYSNPTEAIWALGPPDNLSASLDDGGMIVLDMGNSTVITDGLGDDVTVYEQGDDEGYDVYVSQQWNGPWNLIGTGLGTTSFDLANSGLDSARFVKIIDDDISSFDGYPGADIDAVQGLSPQSSSLFITNISAGWNFISIPSVQDFLKSNITISQGETNYSWQQAVSLNLISDYVFGWDRSVQSYYFTSDFQSGDGYWLYATENCSLWIEDHHTGLNENITTLHSGWNSVGINGEYQLQKQDIKLEKDFTTYDWNQAVTQGFVNNFLFAWNSQGQVYEFSDQLNPGNAYWLYATTDLLLSY